jgi:hypothetical protein
MKTTAAAPKSGRELAAWLAEHKLVRILHLKGTPFVGEVVRLRERSIEVAPIGAGRPVHVPMPAKWNAEGKTRKTAQENLHIREGLAFTDSGFKSFGVEVRYLDESDPFAMDPNP